MLLQVTNSSSFPDLNKIHNRPIMSEKKHANILHFFIEIRYKITNENSNTLLNSELINESENPQTSPYSTRKNIQAGGEKKKQSINKI